MADDIAKLKTQLEAATRKLAESEERFSKVLEQNVKERTAELEAEVAERRLSDAQIRRLATVLRDSSDAIMIQDFAGRITAWNRGAKLMYGYGEAEALQMNIERLIPTEKAAEQKEFTRRLAAGEAITSFETQRVTKDGRILDVWLTVTKLVDDAGAPIGIASTGRDITERKKEESTLRRLATVVRDSNDAITIQDLAGWITASNRGSELMYGYREEEALRLNIEHLTPPDKMAEQKEFTRRLAAGEAITSFETQRVTKDGRILDVWLTVTKLVDDAGAPIGIAATGRDVTERKRMEEELRKREEKYRRLVETSLEAVWFLDDEFRTTEVNAAAIRMVGYGEQELIGRPFMDLIFEEDRLLQVQEFERRKRGESNQYERRIRCKDGSEKWLFLSAKALADASGAFIGSFALMTDVTERKRAEKELLQARGELEKTIAELQERNVLTTSMLEDLVASRFETDIEHQRLSVALKIAPWGIVLLDQRGEVLLSNPAAVKILAVEYAVLTAKAMASIPWFSWSKILEDVLNKRKILTEDLVTRQDPLHVIHLNALPVTEGEAKSGALLVFTDVTQELELEHAREELLTNVSHELRTPIAMLKLLFSNMSAGIAGELSDAVRQSVGLGNKATDRLSILVEGILDYSRLARGAFRMYPEEASILKILVGIRETYEPSMHDQHRRFSMDVSAVRDPMLSCDSQRIQQVFSNLLNNALKFTEEDGRITIVASDTPEEIQVEVADDGIGIPPEYHASIFERFRQVGREYGPGAKGLGLGLSLCKEIIEHHGGRIWVESDVDHGTTFRFTLPRSGPPTATEEAHETDSRTR